MNKKTDRDKDGLGYKYLGSRPRPERPPQQAEQAYVNGKQKFPFANKPSPNHSHLYIRLTTTMCRSLDLRSRSFLPQDEMDELSRAMPALTKSDLYNCTTQLLETRWAALSPFLRAPVRDVRLYSFPVQATLGDNQDKYHSNLGLEELHSKRTEEFQREVTFLRPSVDPPPHHVVRFLAAASISRVVEKLQCLRQRCLEDPTYMVVISPARKPPWPTRKLMSLHQNNSSTFKSTTQSTKLNMNQLPRSDGVNPPNLTTSHYQGSFCPSLDGQHYGTGSDITSIDLFSNNMMSMEGIPDNYQFDASPHRHIAAKRRTSFSQSIPINSRSRRRTLDNITSFGSIIDEPKRKRMRERGDAIIENIPQNGLPDIPKQGPTQAAQHEAIRSSRPATVEKLFACPFYKRDPGKYNTKAWKACSIPEGRDISRLKEHIYRKHCSGRRRCDRCFAEFEREYDLQKHYRLEVPCPISNPHIDIDTIDEAQKQEIQKKQRGISEEEKWKRIYAIIFKLDPTSKVPSPYCDAIEQESSAGDIRDNDGILAEFEAFLRRQVDNNGRNVSKINDCLDFVKSFRRECVQENLVGVAPPEMPPLVYDYSDDTSRASGSHEFSPTLTAIEDGTSSINFSTASGNELPTRSILDELSVAHFDKVFPLDGSRSFPGILDLGDEVEALRGV